MKIIVTGGAGFIGSHLCEKLLKNNHHVICIDNFITGRKKNLTKCRNHKKFSLLVFDVIKPLPAKITADAIFHLASPASPNHHSILSYHTLSMETMMVNTVGTLELLKFARKNKAKFLFASSSEVYGDPEKHPQNENYYGNVSPTGPRSVYDEAKRFGEALTSFFVRKYSLDARIARIFNTYGPRMQKADMRMISLFVNQALEKSPITIFGDGLQTRSLIYVDDLVEGLIRLMFYPKTKGEVINLGSTEEHSVLEYANLVKEIVHSSSRIIFSEKLPQDDPKKRCPNISRAKKLLNWHPTTPLKQGLAKMINYYQKNNP